MYAVVGYENSFLLCKSEPLQYHVCYIEDIFMNTQAFHYYFVDYLMLYHTYFTMHVL